MKKIKLPFKLKKSVLAFGSQTKNALCFAEGEFAEFSRVHPDLTSPKDILEFEKDAKNLLKKSPKVIACDAHPEYCSTKYAQNLKLATTVLQLIQHHHAHIASCMADNGIKNQAVIGVAFDGTGLGDDGVLWGGEFFIGNYKNFKRAAHLAEIPLLGGERAIIEPWRLTAAWLDKIYQDRFLKLNIAYSKLINKNNWQFLKKMQAANINSPLTTSVGRLFDAAGSLVLAKKTARFEAELAIELERLAGQAVPCARPYPFKVKKSKGQHIIDPGLLFRGIAKDLKAKKHKEEIAYKFHFSVGEMISRTCLALKREYGINQVVLSGGVFQNKLLLRLASDLLYKKGFRVYKHNYLSCNDSGIALGQALIAGMRS